MRAPARRQLDSAVGHRRRRAAGDLHDRGNPLGTPWFTLALGIVGGVMMVCYVAVSARTDFRGCCTRCARGQAQCTLGVALARRTISTSDLRSRGRAAGPKRSSDRRRRPWLEACSPPSPVRRREDLVVCLRADGDHPHKLVGRALVLAGIPTLRRGSRRSWACGLSCPLLPSAAVEGARRR